MRVLKYENRKVDPIYWDVSTSEKKRAAFRHLFKELEAWGFYAELDEKSIKELEKEAADVERLSSDLSEGRVPELMKKDVQRKLEDRSGVKRQLSDAKHQAVLYKAAKGGDTSAMMTLLEARTEYEYEDWEIIDVVNPLRRKR